MKISPSGNTFRKACKAMPRWLAGARVVLSDINKHAYALIQCVIGSGALTFMQHAAAGIELPYVHCQGSSSKCR
jgi:hypothetical protein